MEKGHHRKAENKLYQGTNHYTTHQMHILKQNEYDIISASFNNRGLYISTRSRNPIGSCHIIYLKTNIRISEKISGNIFSKNLSLLNGQK